MIRFHPEIEEIVDIAVGNFTLFEGARVRKLLEDALTEAAPDGQITWLEAKRICLKVLNEECERLECEISRIMETRSKEYWEGIGRWVDGGGC